MTFIRNIRTVLLIGVAAVACRTGFDFSAYQSDRALYDASLAALNSGRAAFAAGGFEKLSLSLGPRDSLRPLTFYYLGVAQSRQKNFASAAQTFMRIPAEYPDDTLADDAMFAAAEAYDRMWKDPELDPAYGEAARSTLGNLLQTYPQTPLREKAFAQISDIENRLATKDYLVAESYYRIGNYTGAIRPYLTDVLEKYPATPRARDARILMVKAYKKLKWQDETAEQCLLLREMYRGDREVQELCGAARATDTTRY